MWQIVGAFQLEKCACELVEDLNYSLAILLIQKGFFTGDLVGLKVAVTSVCHFDLA